MCAEKLLHEYLLDAIVYNTEANRKWDGENVLAEFKDGNYYRGTFSKGFMDQNGEYFWKESGTHYTGHFRRNVITGVGKYSWIGGSTYFGEVKDSLRDGQGKYQALDKSYDGHWQNGVRQGTGTMVYAQHKAFYEGSWSLSNKNGIGKMVYPTGAIYVGHWKDNIRTGFGKMVWKYGEIHQIYEGMWEGGKPHGKGSYYWLYPTDVDENIIHKAKRNYYEGEWAFGRRHGVGTFFYNDGSVYSGEWKENKKHGKGAFLDTNGNTSSGIFNEDKQDFIDRTVELEPTLFLEDIGVVPNTRECQQIQSLLFRYNNKLKEIYIYYSNLPSSSHNDESLYLNNLQLSQLLTDSELLSIDCNLADFLQKIESPLNKTQKKPKNVNSNIFAFLNN